MVVIYYVMVDSNSVVVGSFVHVWSYKNPRTCMVEITMSCLPQTTHCKCTVFVNYSAVSLVCKYHIAQIFGGEKPWPIWWITGGLLNFTIQILTMSCEKYEK